VSSDNRMRRPHAPCKPGTLPRRRRFPSSRDRARSVKGVGSYASKLNKKLTASITSKIENVGACSAAELIMPFYLPARRRPLP
jgi:hypothetical protein